PRSPSWSPSPSSSEPRCSRQRRRGSSRWEPRSWWCASGPTRCGWCWGARWPGGSSGRGRPDRTAAPASEGRSECSTVTAERASAALLRDRVDQLVERHRLVGAEDRRAVQIQEVERDIALFHAEPLTGRLRLLTGERALRSEGRAILEDPEHLEIPRIDLPGVVLQVEPLLLVADVPAARRKDKDDALHEVVLVEIEADGHGPAPGRGIAGGRPIGPAGVSPATVRRCRAMPAAPSRIPPPYRWPAAVLAPPHRAATAAPAPPTPPRHRCRRWTPRCTACRRACRSSAPRSCPGRAPSARPLRPSPCHRRGRSARCRSSR